MRKPAQKDVGLFTVSVKNIKISKDIIINKQKILGFFVKLKNTYYNFCAMHFFFLDKITDKQI